MSASFDGQGCPHNIGGFIHRRISCTSGDSVRLVEVGSGSGLQLGIGVLVMVLVAAALTPAVLGGPKMPAGSQTIPGGVSARAAVLAGAGNFTPPHSDSGYDANGNGLFDFLLVNASVQISMPGFFTVLGTLHDANYSLQIHNSTSAGRPVGPAILPTNRALTGRIPSNSTSTTPRRAPPSG